MRKFLQLMIAHPIIVLLFATLIYIPALEKMAFDVTNMKNSGFSR